VVIIASIRNSLLRDTLLLLPVCYRERSTRHLNQDTRRTSFQPRPTLVKQYEYSEIGPAAKSITTAKSKPDAISPAYFVQ
jgi:hypothetical protein